MPKKSPKKSPGKFPQPQINSAAALHWAGGALDSPDVHVGEHSLTGFRVVIPFPDGAKVIRSEGTEGNGFNAKADDGKPPLPSLAAVLLFLQRCGAGQGQRFAALWLECLTEAKERDLKADELVPPEALAAAKNLEIAVQRAVQPRLVRTPAKRIGIDLAKVIIEPIPKET